MPEPPARAGRFGIEKRPALRDARRDLAVSNRIQKIVRKLRQSAPISVEPCCLCAGKRRSSLKVLAEFICDHLPFGPFLDEAAGRASFRVDRCRRRLRSTIGEAGMHNGDALAETGQLIVNVEHSRMRLFFAIIDHLFMNMRLVGLLTVCDVLSAGCRIVRRARELPEVGISNPDARRRAAVHGGLCSQRHILRSGPFLLLGHLTTSVLTGRSKYPKHLGPSDKFAEDKFIFVYQDVRGRSSQRATL